METALPELVDATILSRFAFDKGHVKTYGLHPRAFIPNQDDSGCWVLSTLRLDGLNEDEIWALAKATIESLRGRPIRARGDLPVEVFKSYDLEIDPDNDPFRHVSVAGWSDDDLERNTTAAQLSHEVRKRNSAYRNPSHPDYS